MTEFEAEQKKNILFKQSLTVIARCSVANKCLRIARYMRKPSANSPSNEDYWQTVMVL